MTSSPYLRKRGNVFHFRLVLPGRLQEHLGKRELVCSLKTAYVADANRKARRLMARVDQLAADLLREPMADLKPENVKSLVDSYVREVLEETEQDRATNGPIPGSLIRDELRDNECSHDQIQADLRENRFDFIATVVDRLLNERGLTVSPESDVYKRLCREMLKGHLHIFDVELARTRGDYSKDPMFSAPAYAASPQPPEEISPPFSEVVAAFVTEHVAANAWTEKTREENEALLRLFVEVMGDIPIRAVDHEAVRRYKNIVMKLPANIRKDARYRDKTIAEILEMDNVKPMAVNSVNKRLGRLSSLLGWAVRHGYTDKNCADGVSVPVSKRNDQFRDAFNATDLEVIFGTPIFQEKKYRYSYQYWVPLIGLYSGARIDEICQLHLEDIREVDGVWVFDINGREPRKLKTKAAERLVPVHSKLIEFGLLRHAERLRKDGETRLFPELRERRDGFGQDASRWFSRYKKSLGMPETKVFHSFRHTVANELKQAGAEHTYIAEILGHENSSITTGRYGKRYEPANLRRVLELLRFSIQPARLLHM